MFILTLVLSFIIKLRFQAQSSVLRRLLVQPAVIVGALTEILRQSPALNLQPRANPLRSRNIQSVLMRLLVRPAVIAGALDTAQVVLIVDRFSCLLKRHT